MSVGNPMDTLVMSRLLWVALRFKRVTLEYLYIEIYFGAAQTVTVQKTLSLSLHYGRKIDSVSWNTCC